MKLSINYTYQVQYTPPRMHKPRQMPMTASNVFDISELDPAETEHVANVVERKGFDYSSDKYARKKGDPPVRILHADGCFWREDMSLALLQQQAEDGDIKAGYLEHVTHRSTQSSELGDVKDLSNEARAWKVLRSVPQDRWNDDGGARIAEQFRQRIKNMAVYDGSVFVRTPMPVITISDEVYRDGIGIGFGRSHGNDESSYHDDGATAAFNLDELDAARKFYKATKRKDQDPSASVVVEILRPGIWEAAAHRDAVVRIARRALDQALQHPERLPVATMDKIYDLRDAMIECGGEVTPMLIQVLEDLKAMQPPSQEQIALWQEQATQYEGRYDSNKGRCSQLATESAGHIAGLAAIAGKALLRWEMRKPDASWEHRADACPAVWNDRGSMHQVLTLADARVLERTHGIDLSAEIADCVEGRGRLHVAVTGQGGMNLKHLPAHAVLAEGEDGSLRLVAASPQADLDRIASVVEEIGGRSFAPTAVPYSPSMGI